MGKPLSIEEMDKAICKMSLGKSSGIDGLTAESLVRSQNFATQSSFRKYLCRKSLQLSEIRNNYINSQTKQRHLTVG